MSDKQRNAGRLSRRELLHQIAAAVAVVGNCSFSLEAGRHVHRIAQQEKEEAGAYTPHFFKEHEYKMVQHLTGLIIPADEKSGGAREAGAPPFIDLLCSQNDELAEIFSGGLLWLDHEMRSRYGTSFIESSHENQTEMLSRLDQESLRLQQIKAAERYSLFEENTNYGGFRDYRAVGRGELAAGANFFNWLRRMTLDAFYTSPIGIADVGYQGNQFSNEYVVPEEVLRLVDNLAPHE